MTALARWRDIGEVIARGLGSGPCCARCLPPPASAAVALRAGEPLRLARKSVALLAYIALAGPATRTRVADVFWGTLDNASARRNLRRELHRLGDVQAANFVVSDGKRLSLAAGIVVDVPAFEHLLASAPSEALPL